MRKYQPGDVVRVVGHRAPTYVALTSLLPIGSEHTVEQHPFDEGPIIGGWPISKDPRETFFHIVELVHAAKTPTLLADRIADRLAATGLPITSAHRAVILAVLGEEK